MHPSHSPLPDLGGVELVHFPDEERLRDRLARGGVPRMLILAEDAPPPHVLAFDEDWIRRPFDERDLVARAERLAAAVEQLAATDAWVDDERVLHRGHRTVVLTSAEAVVAGALLAARGTVVTRHDLSVRLGTTGTRAVDAVVYRLRRRVVGLGLSIRTSRGRGFLLFE